MLAKAVAYARKVFFICPSVPEQVDIEITTACNLNCKMCKRQTIDFGNKYLPYEQFTAIIDALPKGIKLVTFGGYGEMLLHPRFCDMARHAKARGYKTETTTNGTLLNTDEKIIALLESGLDSLRVSVDHVIPPENEPDVGHVFSEKLLANLKRLSQLRKERNTPITLGINTVVHAGNVDHIIDIIRFAEELNFDLVDLIRLDTCANAAQRTLHEQREHELYKTVSRMKKHIKVITPLNRFAGIKRFYALGRNYCPHRFQSCHVRINGAVTPCAFGFATHDFGNIHQKALKDIWQGPAFKGIRKNHNNPVCRSCAIFTQPSIARKQPAIPLAI